MTETARKPPAEAVTGMVDHVLALAATWPSWDGRPAHVDDRVYTPHKAIRRVADHLIDHLAELEARLAGEYPRPDHWHASALTTEADLAPFTPQDLDEARSRLTRLARIWANRLDALSDDQLDHSPGEGWSFRKIALHLGESTYYADAVGDLSRDRRRAGGGPMTAFAELHHGDEPLLLPNAWDHASAGALAAQGFRAIGTTSLGVAAAAGLSDGTSATRDETLRLALALGSEPYLLSVDAEDGYSEDPDDVGEFARELVAVGAVGVNLEDRFGSPALHAAKIAAVKSAAPDLFVNARTDTYWLGDGEGTIARLDAYQQAGADGVFVPGLTRPQEIAALVRHLSVPLNILYTPTGPTVPHLADLGVRRVSLGSLLYRRALGAALEAVAEIRAGRTPCGATPSYGEVEALSRRGDPTHGEAT